MQTKGYPAGNQHVIDNTSSLSVSNTVWDYCILGFILLCVYGFFLGSHPLLVPDEVRYSEVAREMLVQHQFLTPHLNGIDFFDKPILFYWLQALSMSLFGVNPWAIRLIPMLFGIGGVLVVFGTVRYLFDRLTGWVAAMMLASSPLYFFAAHYANLDLEVAVLITTSLCAFLRSYDPQKIDCDPKWLYVAYFFAGLAVLTKGLIGIVFPIMIIGFWVLFTRQWGLIKKLRMVSGLGLAAVVVLPWLILVAYRNPGFLYYFFYIQQFSRFLTAHFNSIQPVWFYIPVLFLGSFPWILSIKDCIPKKNQPKNPINQFLWIWVGVVFVFFSLPHSKLLGYILPALPPLVMLLSQHYMHSSLRLQRRIILVYVSFLMLVALEMIFLPYELKHQIPQMGEARFIYGAISLLLGLFLAYVLFNTRSLKNKGMDAKNNPYSQGVIEEKTERLALIMGLAWSTIVIYNLILATLLFMPKNWVSTFFPMTQIQDDLRPLLKPTDKLVSYFDYYQALPITFQQPVFIVHHWDTPNLFKKDNWHGEFAYSAQFLQPAAKTWLLSEQQFQALWNSKERVFVWVSRKKLSVFQSKLALTDLCIVSKAQKIVVVTNDKHLCA